MCSGITSSSSVLSSENDYQMDDNEIYEERPFVAFCDFSSDEVINCGIDVDPFNESPNNYNKQKEISWSTHKDSDFRKAASMPLTNRKYLLNFYDEAINGESHSLPTSGTGTCDSLHRINSDVLYDLLCGEYNVEYSVIDCRFPYEYEGGHIRDAINIYSKNMVDSLFKNPKVLIFHCEYSSVRAPKLAQHVRNLDRKLNTYPNLSIPEIYILEGGYKEFFYKYGNCCTPQGYTSMSDADYKFKRNKYC